MEASDSRPAGLRVLPGGGKHFHMEPESDEERERREVGRVTDALKMAIKGLPAKSLFRKPFTRLRQELSEALRRRRRSD